MEYALRTTEGGYQRIDAIEPSNADLCGLPIEHLPFAMDAFEADGVVSRAIRSRTGSMQRIFSSVCRPPPMRPCPANAFGWQA